MQSKINSLTFFSEWFFLDQNVNIKMEVTFSHTMPN